jgi:uncharacterized protein YjiS (DUF1127 family)
MKHALNAWQVTFHFSANRHENVYIALHQRGCRRGREAVLPCNWCRKNKHSGVSVMIVSTLIARVRAYMRYRASVRALSNLSERELADIGLTRGDIDAVSRESAFA